MYLEKAKLLLDMQYDAYYDKADEFGRMFMDEKKRQQNKKEMEKLLIEEKNGQLRLAV